MAKARPQQTIQAHIEGGKAGGHHSWEDLDDLLMRHYAKLRQVPNLVVCVGGGIGTPEQASAYLFGTWSHALGLAPMPVDAVFLGTRLMAVAEAKTSSSVKQALVSARGDVAWPKDGAVVGGVTSGKSSLDAPIYYLDNAAARCGRLLDSVAGDAAKVTAQRAEIIEALAHTAKPYFGDVDAMTPSQVLVRMRALCADAAWQPRIDALVTRFAERGGQDGLVHPEDARFFLEVCKLPGKPVPFVPVVDADVRRWFKSDSLWQSHDARFVADAVLSIPGPAAVAAITRADEPVADVLASFVTCATARADATPTRDAHDAHEAHEARAARARSLLVAVAEDGRWYANPLRSLPESCVTVDERGALSARLPVADAALDLCLSLVDDSKGGHLRWDRAAYLRAQHDFYSRAIFGEVVDAVPLFDEAIEASQADAARVDAFRVATHDDGALSSLLPPAMTFAVAWRAIFRALAGAAPDVVRLVHESDEVSGAGIPVGAPLAVRARVRSVEQIDGGRRVTIVARVLSARDEDASTLLATCTSRFFIRGVGVAAKLKEARDVVARLHIDDAALAFLRALPFV
ncbi:MAG TPA: fatty acid synthase subunit beta domain-containing protein, partial [Myxococcota bacterium]